MNTIKFLGTAGARFVVTKQLRASGGIWLSLDNTTLLIDPGPGSLLRCLSSKPKLNPMELDGIVLTHRHLDHANDVNIMIEAMTNGGFKKNGVLFAPSDALNDDPVVLNYVRSYLNRVETLQEKATYKIRNLRISTPVKHVHGSETYGLNIAGKQGTISLISDTQYFDDLASYYRGDILILNVVRLKESNKILHLSLVDAEKIISQNKPKLSIITHFGMTMIKAKPWEIAAALSKKLDVTIIAARDGMNVNIDQYLTA
jgi:phosphoribosyl 1,2-cyclic phosphodiesterase